MDMRRRVKVRLPYDLYERVQECRRSGLNLTQLVVKALESYFEGGVGIKKGIGRVEGLDALLGEVRSWFEELRSLLRDVAEELSEIKSIYLGAGPTIMPRLTPSKPHEELPSFFRDNPWLDILRRRGESDWPGP